MPKSRKRGGEKAHRKRVQARNQNIQNQRTQMQKMWEEEMMKKLEEMRAPSGETENQEIDTSESMNISL
jgi:hypothetical protein